MLARIRKAIEEKDQGFTLIELLVVMIIIGILAAVAIPVFLSQRAKARDAAVKSDVSIIGKEIATYYVDNTGAVPGVAIDAGKWEVAGNPVGNVSDGVTFVEATGTDDTNWCVALTHATGDKKTFSYSAASGLQAGDCTP